MEIEKIIDRQDYKDLLNDRLDLQQAENIIQTCLGKAPSRETPKILHTLGIPGAGKSTYVSGVDHDNIVVIGFDNVMEAIPAYQEDKKTKGSQVAFESWELPARMIGYEILHRAIKNKNDIIFDHSGSRRDHVDFLKAAKSELGYRVEIVLIDTPLDTAKQRIERREKLTGRHVPLSYLPERLKTINSLLDDYRAIADIFTISKTSAPDNDLQAPRLFL